MKFFAVYDGMELKEVGKIYGDVVIDFEITESEYNTLLSEIRDKAALVDKLYSGEITIADVPEGWREETQRRVEERIAEEGAAAEQDIPSEEFYSMIEEVL